jgi:hypothetical protein
MEYPKKSTVHVANIGRAFYSLSLTISWTVGGRRLGVKVRKNKNNLANVHLGFQQWISDGLSKGQCQNFAIIREWDILLKFYITVFGIEHSPRLSWSRIHERTISLRFIGIILRVLRLEVSVCNVYITNQFQTTFDQIIEIVWLYWKSFFLFLRISFILIVIYSNCAALTNRLKWRRASQHFWI